MRGQDLGFDYNRYRQLLTEAGDENKRLALIDLLIRERAMERLAAAHAAERAAATATMVSKLVRSART
jgi:hypothetical protein